MPNFKLFPLALLYVGGDSIDGATKFQKLVFLAQEETDLPEIFDYQADKYGPFSPELAQVLEVLEDRGLIEKDTRTTRAGHDRYDYRLTTRGHKIASEMAKDEEFEPLFENGEEVKTSHNHKPLDSVLKYVYRKYPDKTVNTELDLDKLFS